MRDRDHERKLRRPEPPDGVRRLPIGYGAALIAFGVSVVFVLIAMLFTPAVCRADVESWCAVGLGFLAGLVGFLVGIMVAAWLLRLGWVFALSYIALLLGLVCLADRFQNVLVLGGFLLIPVVAAAASIRWTTPIYKGWQFWLTMVVSAGLIGWFGLWMFG